MAMGGFSTQTSPFKPPFPPYFWLCSSSASRRSFWWASSKMAVLREPVCTIQSDKKHSVHLNVVSIGTSVNIKQYSSYNKMSTYKNSRPKGAREMAYMSPQTSKEMEEHKNVSIPAMSGASESTRANLYSPNHGKPWLELSQHVRNTRLEVSNHKNYSAGVSVSKPDKPNNIHDRIALDDMFHTSGVDNITTSRNPEKLLLGVVQTSDDQLNPQCSSPKEKVNIERQTYTNINEHKARAINGTSGLASGKKGNTIYRNRCNSRIPSNPAKKYSGSTLVTPEVPSGKQANAVSTNSSSSRISSNPVEKTSCSTHMTLEVPQPNGLAGNNIADKMAKSPGQIEDIHLAESMEKSPGKNEDIHLRERLNCIYDEVLVVDNIILAKEIVGLLTNQYRHLVHACDTEVAGIDVKGETPVDHGEVICFSIYSGAEANFGNGKSCIWVDVLDGGGKSLLAIFSPFFEDPSIKKVWHNYSFDNHVIENYGLKLSGFHADTMHMARLWDSSRRIIGGYSLEALTSDRGIMSDAGLSFNEKLIGKISMKTIFGRRKVKKDGSEGKIITIPPVEELQRVERKPWICYSALDSVSTLKLYESLKKKLSRKEWKLNEVIKGSMFDFYEKYWRPFGELLVKLETEGTLVDRTYLAEIEKVAKVEQQIAADRFRNWASKHCPDAKYMNVGSDAQLRVLFFGGTQNRKNGEFLEEKKDFQVLNVDNIIEEGKKNPTKFRKITLHKIGEEMQTDLFTASGWPSMSGLALKALCGKVSAEYEFTDEALDFEVDESIDIPETEVKEEALVEASAYGTAYAAFGGGSKGIEACHAIASLCEVCSIDSLISNFILPLQGSHVAGKNGRIHCSLNINTETGRLSARRPNLQNQPALEKDRYKIRQAFIAAPGNSLIVADYGQLELRILAHLANCKSMLDAFKSGGDFHSRTAMNMYPYIHDAVEQNNVLLEWYPQPGEDKPPVPLLKDAFASERRKAKTLNFSIAYGKTTVGLARDWKVSLEEAKETVDRWYSERKEVLHWQEMRKREARDKGHVHTLLGRARRFPSFKNGSYSQRGHIERAAINTPVQGSAADVAMCAMLEIEKNARLKELGWRLLLQVHDEVILEGPTESAEVAKGIVIDCMSKPFNGKNILKVDLSVDAKFAQNWYSAK